MTQIDPASPLLVDQTSTLTLSPPATAAYARPRPGAARRQRSRAMLALVSIGGLALIGMAGSWTGLFERFLGGAGPSGEVYVVRPIDLSITLTESGELRPLKSIDVKCEMDGFQNTILFVVDESSTVKKGDLLVEFASDKLNEDLLTEEASLSKIEAELAAARNDLDIQLSKNTSDIEKAQSDLEIARLELTKYMEGDYGQKLKTAKLDIEQSRLDIDKQKEELAKSERLAEKGYVTAIKLKELRFELQKAEWTLEKHLLSQDILLKYEHPKDRTSKETAVAQAAQEFERVKSEADGRKQQAEARVRDTESRKSLSESRLTRLRGELARCRILSPADGVVQYAQGDNRHDESRIAPGQSVWKGQTLLQLPDTSQMMVATRIHEGDRHMIEIGQPCVVRVPAVPGESFTGKLSKMSQYADSANRWMNPDLKEHTAEILLDNTEAPLSPGDTAEIKLLVGELKNVLAVPVICVFSRGTRSFVFVKSGVSARPAEVQLGRSNTSMVEVGDGLNAGDRVLMHVPDDLLALLPKEDMGEKVPEAEQGKQAAGPSRGGPAAGAGPPAGGANATRAAGTTTPSPSGGAVSAPRPGGSPGGSAPAGGNRSGGGRRGRPGGG